MDVVSTGFGVLIAVVVLIALGVLFFLSRMFRKVEQGKALIVSKVRRVDVTFTGAVVLPVLHKAEIMDISVKTIEISRTGREGLICQDNIRADIRITFFVRVNKTTEDVIKVAQAIGTARASSETTLQELFSAKFSEALKTVGKQLDFVDLYTKRNDFRDQIIEVIGTDLNGYSLEDAAIDFLEQTPVGSLDPKNILDAQGIRKITELTAIEAVRTNDFRRNEEKEITRQDVDAREAILELERRRTDAEIKQRREIETIRAREEAEIALARAEETLRSETARIKTEQQLGVQTENKSREIAVAEKNRERVIAIETERIEKDRMLEVIGRQRETELSTIAKDKEVETEKRSMAEVIRERIAVEKTVAEQEENIKRLRVVEEAERTRQAVIINAEAEAQESLVKDIKAAEASEAASKFKARELLLLAESRQQAAELDARAAIRLAEGKQAEAAAFGLADVQVRERNAEVIEKTGRAEAEVIEKTGLAEAAVERQKAMVAAEAIKEKLLGEAIGLEHKAGAMATLDDVTRAHEEYRLRLEMEKEIRLAGITVHKEIAEAQAMVVAAGLEKANIDIVGGDSVFFDKLVGSITLGKSIDGFVEHSTVVQGVGARYLNGEGELAEDLHKLASAVSTADVANLSVAAAVASQLKKDQAE
ncbi:flotillin family protein [Actinoplanes sp. HUAS TT8]|uniref:flotillin family protein n=1 Tax=Actinoplanes sp. HUAS TT8 TaxID=3447453 RepID=UPI003F527BC4